MTTITFFSVGRGTGPTTVAPARVTVSTILRAEVSMTSWSYDLSRMRIFCPAMCDSLSVLRLTNCFALDALLSVEDNAGHYLLSHHCFTVKSLSSLPRRLLARTEIPCGCGWCQMFGDCRPSRC